MSPLLIDQQKIKQLAILYVVSLVLAFSAGYYLAYQLPEKKPQSRAPEVKKILPSTDLKTAAPSEKKGKASAGEKKPSVKKNKTEKIKAKPEKKKKPKKETKKSAPKTPKKTSADKGKKTRLKKPEKKAQIKKTKPELKLAPLKTEIEPAQNTPPEKLALRENKNKNFSIQVGAFASQENAQKLVDEIKAKGFEAYISEYVSTKGVVKYNVRFGHFNEKTQARKRLDAFKQIFTMPAYVIINQ